MRLNEPSWWYQPKPSATARALRPLSALYGWAAERRIKSAKPEQVAVPVICVGNLVAGGTGKTPLTIAIVRELIRLGERPAILTRGYGGRTTAPRWVDAVADTAAEVGDEPLLLAEHAPTLVCRDRVRGAQMMLDATQPCSVIVMDDGLQNPSLAKNLRFAVVDSRRGVGNGEVLPSGPLRAPLAFQFDLVDAILVNHPPMHGDSAGPSEVAAWLKQNFPGPVLEGTPQASSEADWVNGARVVAFAGIANPQRFFNLLGKLGADVAETITLPDHHAFTEKDAERIIALAWRHGALPVTTEKDRVRLRSATGQRGLLWEQCRSVGIDLVLTDRNASRLTALINTALTTHRSKR